MHLNNPPPPKKNIWWTSLTEIATPVNEMRSWGKTKKKKILYFSLSQVPNLKYKHGRIVFCKYLTLALGSFLVARRLLNLLGSMVRVRGNILVIFLSLVFSSVLPTIFSNVNHVTLLKHLTWQYWYFPSNLKLRRDICSCYFLLLQQPFWLSLRALLRYILSLLLIVLSFSVILQSSCNNPLRDFLIYQFGSNSCVITQNNCTVPCMVYM